MDSKTVRERITNGAKVTGKVFGALLSGLAEGMERAAEYHEKYQTPEVKLPTTVTLGAEQLKQLSEMSSWQLEALFKGKKVELSNDPATYAQLQHFSSWQLQAIFGKDEG